MKNDFKNGKRRTAKRTKKTNNVKKKKGLILFLAIVILGAVCGAIIKTKVFDNYKSVQASPVVETEAADNGNDDESESITQEGKDNDVKTKVEEGKYIEKYIKQQTLGQMPDGADGRKVVYLTFDDGPSEKVTPQILDILKEEGVQATFFVTGKHVDQSEKTREMLKRQINEGHSIGIHTYTHDYGILYPNGRPNVDNFMGEVEKTKNSLKNALGNDFDTKIVRLPGGHMSWRGTDALDAKFEQVGYSYIDWNAESGDAENKGMTKADGLYSNSIKSAGKKEKVVMLMHDIDDKQETVKVLPDVIHYFKDKGYEFKIIK